ncbi:hypothetical protein QTP88_016085 [Uroleucon formosanum]
MENHPENRNNHLTKSTELEKSLDSSWREVRSNKNTLKLGNRALIGHLCHTVIIKNLLLDFARDNDFSFGYSTRLASNNFGRPEHLIWRTHNRFSSLSLGWV